MLYSLDVSNKISCSMFGRMKQSHGWESTSPRIISENLFVFVIDGNATFDIEGTMYEVSTGDILIIPAETWYSARTKDICEYFFFHFSGKIDKVDTMPAFSTINNSFSFYLQKLEHECIYFNLKTSNKDVFNKVHTSIINCMEYRSYFTPSGRLLFDAEFSKIMFLLGEIAEQSRNNKSAIVKKMIIYIKKNLTKPLSLSEISSECSVSSPYASHIFKKHMNMTVTEYINSEKLYYACDLIRNTSMNISEIADYLGYSDVFYFSKLFKKKFGISPSRYCI